MASSAAPGDTGGDASDMETRTGPGGLHNSTAPHHMHTPYMTGPGPYSMPMVHPQSHVPNFDMQNYHINPPRQRGYNYLSRMVHIQLSPFYHFRRQPQALQQSVSYQQPYVPPDGKYGEWQLKLAAQPTGPLSSSPPVKQEAVRIAKAASDEMKALPGFWEHAKYSHRFVYTYDGTPNGDSLPVPIFYVEGPTHLQNVAHFLQRKGYTSTQRVRTDPQGVVFECFAPSPALGLIWVPVAVVDNKARSGHPGTTPRQKKMLGYAIGGIFGTQSSFNENSRSHAGTVETLG